MTNELETKKRVKAVVLQRIDEALDLYADGKISKHQLKWTVLGLGAVFTNPRPIISRFYE